MYQVANKDTTENNKNTSCDWTRAIVSRGAEKGRWYIRRDGSAGTEGYGIEVGGFRVDEVCGGGGVLTRNSERKVFHMRKKYHAKLT